MNNPLRCTCGHFQDAQSSSSSTTITNSHNPPQKKKNNNNNLDASFVHLLSPLGSPGSGKTPLTTAASATARNKNLKKKNHFTNQTTTFAATVPSLQQDMGGGASFLEGHCHLEDLLRAAQGRALPFCNHYSQGEDDEGNENEEDEGVHLCLDCIERVAQAVDRETDRLYEECRAYHRAVELEEERLRTWSKAVSGSWNQEESHPVIDDDDDDDHNRIDDPTTMMQQTIDSFQKEVQLLQDACQQQEEEELAHLQALYREQVLISQQLDELQLQQAEEQNSLEMQGHAFDCMQAHQTKRLQLVLNEVQALEQVDLLNQVMIEWNIPPLAQQHDPYHHQQQQQQIEYPRVNDLRLAFSASDHSHHTSHHHQQQHRLEWEELEAAWSLVAQCVLWVAALTNFSSQEWRIVPLTTGPAKLIQYPPIKAPPQHSTRSNMPPSLSSQQQQVVVVYNLGRPNMAKSLCAFQILLHQLTEHVTHLIQMRQRSEAAMKEQDEYRSTTNRPPHSNHPPFPSSPTQVGSISLERLLLASTANGQTADPSSYSAAHHHYWSRAIYYMASNLQWLCDQTSSLVQTQQQL